MNKNNIPEISTEQHERIMNEVFQMIRRKGLKGTTMDAVASALSMSKRTLYEVYGNKESLLTVCLDHHLRQRMEDIQQIFDTTNTAIEALYRTFYTHLQFLHGTSQHFFDDMDERFKHIRKCYDSNNPMMAGLMCAIDKGIKQGVFRSEINYQIAIRMFSIQMEALKRMQDYFPKEITHTEVFHAIVISFLRTIATPEGIKILDNNIDLYKEESKLYLMPQEKTLGAALMTND